MVLVVLAVAMVFDSVWAASMVFLSLPFALAGVVAVFWVAEDGVQPRGGGGVILVVGLAVHQAILLVDAALKRRRTARREGRGSGLTVAACLDAARTAPA